jgi:serine/threonine protein kinase
MKLDYDHTYDYWSLGCTIYEMITNKILFNGDNDLELLYEIISKLGPLPSELIEKSEYKKKFFTTSKRLRGYKKISFKSMSELFKDIQMDDNLSKLLTLIKSSLVFNKADRSLTL